MQVEVRRVVDTLCTVPPPRFQPGEICRLLADADVRAETLSPYLHFAAGRYTRNLIFRNELFELLALCWSPQSASPIHNHANQLCWLSIQRGALRLDNYRSLDGPGPGARIRLERTGGAQRATVGNLDLQQGDDGIHRVSNPFDEPAVSLHIYSRPYDSCIAYDLERARAREMPLRYWSVEGRVVQQ
jgi:cysteine dioxygenase